MSEYEYCHKMFGQAPFKLGVAGNPWEGLEVGDKLHLTIQGSQEYIVVKVYKKTKIKELINKILQSVGLPCINWMYDLCKVKKVKTN
jgi:hypothetical protein